MLCLLDKLVMGFDLIDWTHWKWDHLSDRQYNIEVTFLLISSFFLFFILIRLTLVLFLEIDFNGAAHVLANIENSLDDDIKRIDDHLI